MPNISEDDLAQKIMESIKKDEETSQFMDQLLQDTGYAKKPLADADVIAMFSGYRTALQSLTLIELYKKHFNNETRFVEAGDAVIKTINDYENLLRTVLTVSAKLIRQVTEHGKHHEDQS